MKPITRSLERVRADSSRCVRIAKRLLHIERNFDQTAGLHLNDSRGNCRRVVSYLRPRRCHQDHDAEPQVSEVMLVPQVLVCRNQHFVAMQNGRRKQVAILELAPRLFEDRVDLVAHQMPAKRCRRTLIKENFHAEI
jgi:hypothetical protein